MQEEPESHLRACDPRLAKIIEGQDSLWPSLPTEDPVWGLVRIVMAQQVSTQVACAIANRAKSTFPGLAVGDRTALPCVADLRALGLPERRAICCVEILSKGHEILDVVKQDHSWESALAGIKGIGPWTISTFRIMILRDPDVLPLGDVGLERAIRKIYGPTYDILQLAERWKPFRSVACWYLWRTLGNQQLG